MIRAKGIWQVLWLVRDEDSIWQVFFLLLVISVFKVTRINSPGQVGGYLERWFNKRKLALHITSGKIWIIASSSYDYSGNKMPGDWIHKEPVAGQGQYQKGILSQLCVVHLVIGYCDSPSMPKTDLAGEIITDFLNARSWSTSSSPPWRVGSQFSEPTRIRC